MKRVVLQVNVKLEDHTGFSRFKPNEEVYKLSESQAKKYAEKWGVEYLQITDCTFLPDKHPCFQRLKMYELDYDEILYLDMDAIILPGCPNPFEVLAGHTLSAVRDYPWDGTPRRPKDYYDEKRALYNKVYGAAETYRPFCSGVMLITKEFLEATKDLWREYLYSFDKASNGLHGGHDQAILNVMVATRFGGIYNELNEDWGPWYRSGKYIEHIGGPFKHFFNLEKFKQKYGFTEGTSTLPTQLKLSYTKGSEA